MANNNLLERMRRFFSLEEGEEPYYEYQDPDLDENEEAAAFRPRPRRRASLSVLHSRPSSEICILDLDDITRAQEAADLLKTKHPVLVNVSGAPREMAVRIVDFLGGVCYALDGQVQKVDDYNFMFTPSNIAISSPRKRRKDGGPFYTDG